SCISSLENDDERILFIDRLLQKYTSYPLLLTHLLDHLLDSDELNRYISSSWDTYLQYILLTYLSETIVYKVVHKYIQQDKTRKETIANMLKEQMNTNNETGLQAKKANTLSLLWKLLPETDYLNETIEYYCQILSNAENYFENKDINREQENEM
ncbi:unnamed protein product, partial [Didymodactylos carnosus]